jgi:hypothetical protein
MDSAVGSDIEVVNLDVVVWILQLWTFVEDVENGMKTK